jgi:hypothetical protein
MTSSSSPEDVTRTAKFMDRLGEDFVRTKEWWLDKEEAEPPKRSSK